MWCPAYLQPLVKSYDHSIHLTDANQDQTDILQHSCEGTILRCASVMQTVALTKWNDTKWSDTKWNDTNEMTQMKWHKTPAQFTPVMTELENWMWLNWPNWRTMCVAWIVQCLQYVSMTPMKIDIWLQCKPSVFTCHRMRHNVNAMTIDGSHSETNHVWLLILAYMLPMKDNTSLLTNDKWQRKPEWNEQFCVYMTKYHELLCCPRYWRRISLGWWVRPTLQYYDKSITCMDATYDYDRTFEFEPELEQLNLTLKRWLQRDLNSMP